MTACKLVVHFLSDLACCLLTAYFHTNIRLQHQRLFVQKARTQDSAKAFMQGLYGGTHTYTDCQGQGGITGHDRVVNVTKHGYNTTYTIHARPKHQDPVLRFFDMCPAYDEYVAQINADLLVSSRIMRQSSLPALMAGPKHTLMTACILTFQCLHFAGTAA